MPSLSCGPTIATLELVRTKPIHVQIREARERAGLTQAELAQLCGFSHQSVLSRMEDGRHAARVDTLERIAQALRVAFVVAWEDESV